MKKTILILLLTILGMTQLGAQDYEYTPFVREGVKWVCQKHDKYNRYGYYTLELKNDVEINGKTYKAMHKYSGNSINEENDTIPVYLREEDRVVYGIVPDGIILPDCPIGIEGGYNQDGTERVLEINEKIQNGEEFVLYDFNDPEGFIKGFLYSFAPQMFITDMTTISGKPARRFIFNYNGHDYCMIDGIGYDGISLGTPLSMMDIWNESATFVHLSEVIENGEVIYSSEMYNHHNYIESVPDIPREGVQWVNERVVIDHGVTTRSYYTYEFKGTDNKNNPICYQYTGDAFDEETASMAAKFLIYYTPGFAHTDYVSDNIPYEKVRAEGRNLIGFGSNMMTLYSWSRTYSDIDMTSPVNFYICNQREDFLNRQNFIEVTPVELEGMVCRRYAYMNDAGEVQAYVVEGIGFDSRDMGDLLTPFTRKPDPDAEYQEWCGLSHVIKDGKIIYKGLRYDDGAVGVLIEDPTGDVNDDGVVDIADVTALIDLVLNGSQLYRAPADMDNDGSVDINDVTDLISIILGNR